MTSLFAQQPSKDAIVEFKAGLCHKDKNSKTVRADARKGVLLVKKSGEDQLVHVMWRERASSSFDLDLILFPDEAHFRRVKECTTGRVYVLEFKTGNLNFFWLQESSTEKDDEYCEAINNAINNKSSDSKASSSSLPSLRASSNSPTSRSLNNNSSSSSGTSTTASSNKSTSFAASTDAASSTSSTTGNNSFASRFDNFLSSVPASAPSILLTDVINTQSVLSTDVLKDKELLAELQQHLPEEERDSVIETLRCPQFRQAVDKLNAVLKQSPEALSVLLASFGLKSPTNPEKTRLETFLKAIMEQAEKESSGAGNQSAAPKSDKMEE